MKNYDNYFVVEDAAARGPRKVRLTVCTQCGCVVGSKAIHNKIDCKGQNASDNSN